MSPDIIVAILFLSKEKYSNLLTPESGVDALPQPFAYLHSPDAFLILTPVLRRSFQKHSNSLTWWNTFSVLLCYLIDC